MPDKLDRVSVGDFFNVGDSLFVCAEGRLGVGGFSRLFGG